MRTYSFSIKEAIRFGWGVTKSNLKFFASIVLVMGILSVLGGSTSGKFFHAGYAPFGFLVNFLVWVLAVVIEIGFLRVSLKFAKGKKGEYGDFLVSFRTFAFYVISSILYFLAIAGGTLLLIVPGIIFGLMFQFYGFFILEGLGTVAALKKSVLITKGARWDLFFFGITTIGIMILGTLAFFVGLFVAIPVGRVAAAYVYRGLVLRGGNVPGVAGAAAPANEGD